MKKSFTQALRSGLLDLSAPNRMKLSGWSAAAPGIVLATTFGVLFSVLAVLRHLSFHTYAFDLGLYHQAVWNTLHGRPFRYTLMMADGQHLQNLLGDHVSLILLLAVPFYAIHEGAETLLVLQALIAASAAIPLFLFGRKVTGSVTTSTLLVAVYFLHPALQGALLFDFHAVVPGAAFLLWAFWLAEEGSTAGLAGAAALAALSQENIALAVACLGAVVFLRGRRRAGIVLAAGGVGWFLFCFFAILPHFNAGTGASHFVRYLHLGETPFRLLRNALVRPKLFLAQVVDPLTFHYARDLLVPWALLPIFSPVLVLVGASELAFNVLSNFPPQRTIDYQYAVVPLAALALAASASTAKISRWLEGWRGWPARRVGTVIAAVAVSTCLLFQRQTYGGVRGLVAPYAETYQATEHDREGRRLLFKLPPVSTSAQSAITPHLNRAKLWAFPQVFDAERVVLDTGSATFPVHLYLLRGQGPEASYYEYLQRLICCGAYALEHASDGWIVLRRQNGFPPGAPPRPGARGDPPPPLFVGEMALDSPRPSLLHTGEDVHLTVRVRNCSDAVWLTQAESPTGYQTNVGARWIDENGETSGPERRGFLASRLSPGEETVVGVSLAAPTVPGAYSLKLDLVTEKVTWFEAAGGEPLTLRVSVVP